MCKFGISGRSFIPTVSLVTWYAPLSRSYYGFTIYMGLCYWIKGQCSQYLVLFRVGDIKMAVCR